jgi:ferredoxin-NADP reductase
MLYLLALGCFTLLPLCRLWQRLRQKPGRLTLRVSRLRRRGQYLQLTLTHPQGLPLPKARAGQHILLYYRDLQGKPLSRAYSLLQDCSRRRQYKLAIKLESTGRLSQSLATQLEAGEQLQVSLPRGHFLLKRSKKPLLLVAGGIGITPLLSMAWQGLRQRRPVTLVWQARTEQDLLFDSLLRKMPGLRYLPILSAPGTEWPGARGRVDAQWLYQLGGKRADYYCCASQAVMDSLQDGLRRLGNIKLHTELFSAVASTQDFQIRYQHTTASSAGCRSVLQALNQAGASIPNDCLSGSCGLCKKRLQSGSVHTLLIPSVTLADDEILTCCVQAASDLQLAD